MRTLLASLLLLSTTVLAAPNSNIYQVDLPVGSHDEDEQKRVLQQALQKVFERVTGNADIGRNAQVKAALAQAPNLVVSSGYLEGETLMLHVSFEPQRVQQLLQQAQIPVWGQRRPSTLLWLAVNDAQNGRRLISDIAEEAKLFNAIAQDKGLPLQLPLLDLEDTMLVNVNDIIGNFPERLAQGSDRYQSDFFISAQLDQQAANWRYQLSLYPRQRDPESLLRATVQYSGVAADQNAAASAMLTKLTSFYASRYATQSLPSGESIQYPMSIALDGGVSQLVALTGYLRSLGPVKSATLTTFDGKAVTYQLELTSTSTEFERLFALEPRVSPVPAIGEELGVQPRYRWAAR